MYTGILNIYKEGGYTSFDVVARLRGILRQKKIGHTGTLDPDAEGVLPVCLGQATKVVELLTDQDKEYEAVLRLGITTDTLDLSGKILAESEVRVTGQEIREAAEAFRGSYDQIPPMYSALKVNGRKLCDLAREGITVERKARRVQIHELEVLWTEGSRAGLRVRCSKGTYIRSLCQDIGDRLGCGGCMESLIRTRVGSFCREDALKLSEVEKLLAEDGLTGRILPVDGLFMDCPGGTAGAAADKLVANGNRIPAELVQLACGTCTIVGAPPAESGHPERAEEPRKTVLSAENEHPERAEEPRKTAPLAESGHPERVEEPEKTVPPAESGHLERAEEPRKTTPPAESGHPERMEKPQKTAPLAESGHPERAEEPRKTAPPAESGHPERAEEPRKTVLSAEPESAERVELRDGAHIRLYDHAGRFIGLYSYQKRQEDYRPLKRFIE